MLVLEGRALLRGSLERVGLGIEDGRIVRIAKLLDGEEHVDYGDRLLLPGGVDLHVHFRDPGETHLEDFRSGTSAAAAGGVTAVLDMPNTNPPVTSVAAYEEKLAAVRRRANVDFGLYGAIRSPDDVEAFAGRAHAGKVYMAPSAGAIEVTDEAVWPGLLSAGREAGLPLAFHAEHPRLLGSAGTSLEGHHRARPPEAEAAAIRALREARPGGGAVHVAHLSSEAGLRAFEGSGFTAEATPHHLFLDLARPLKAFGKVNPPLRPAADRAALWSALVDGRVGCVASDHAPRAFEDKGSSFAEAPPGVPGVETMLPLLLRRVKAGDLALERFAAAVSENPSRVARIPGGRIEVGAPANLVVVDARRVVRIRARDLHSRCGWTPFEGFEAVFPEATYLRGRLVAEDREVVAEGLGSLLSPSRNVLSGSPNGRP